MPVLQNSNNTFMNKSNLGFVADTSITETGPVQISSQINTDTLIQGKIKTLDLSSADSIFRINEEREIQIQKENQLRYKNKIQKTDTSKLLFENLQIYKTPLSERFNQDMFYQNFLYNLPVNKETENIKNQIVIIEKPVLNQKSGENQKAITEKRIEIEPRVKGNKLHFDWILGVLLLSFIILGFVRLFFNKYLVSLIRSAISYQEASTMFREKNSLMEKASFLVNILFLSNISIFVIQVTQFYNVQFGNLKHYYLYAIIFAILFVFYIYRAFTTWFVGSVFLKQKVFQEYFHNVNIFTKNTGLLIFPVIVTLQFLSLEYLPVIIYIGMAGIGLLYLLQIHRSFQVIIRKNVSVFYMILYLCAFEFAPLLIIYKLLLSLN